MSKIAIRADGGMEIGMGHIMRTLVLAKELAKTKDVFYICKVDNPLSDKYISGINKVKEEGFKVLLIEEDNIIKALQQIKADCLITDSYDVDEEYFKRTKNLFSKTGYIDDMNLHYFNVDFIINQNICATDYNYKCNKDTKLFLGTDYLMLREEFRNSEPIENRKEVKDILITVGGADPYYVTVKLLSFLKDSKYMLHIVIGNSFDNMKEIEELSKGCKNICLHFNPNIIEIMKKCDVAISACGSTVYELAVLGIPTLGVIIADNQENLAKKMSDEGRIYNLGWYFDLSKEKVLEGIERINNKTYESVELYNKLNLKINKFGVIKLADKINEILK